MRRLPPALAATATPRILELLGDGPGRVLELGFAGIHARPLELAEDMLRRASARGVRVVRADATALPFEGGSFDAAVSVFTHTDFDDFPGAVREVARVLRPGTPFVYIGAHPCWIGPHSAYDP